MTQVARPTSDITASTWTVTPLWDKLDDNSDADFISSLAPPTSADVCEVALAPLSAPAAGTVTLRVRIWEAADTTNVATIALYQGATLIATLSLTAAQVTVTPATYSQALSAPELASITDWTDLRVRMSANRTGGTNRSVRIGWVELETPDAAGGGASLTADATVAATGAIDSTAAVIRPADASLTATAAVTPTAAVSRPASVSLAATATLTATASVTTPGGASLTADAALTATTTTTSTAAVNRAGNGTLTATAAITTAAVVARPAASSVPAAAAVTAAATVARQAAVSLTGTATITASATVAGQTSPGSIREVALVGPTIREAPVPTASITEVEPATATIREVALT